MLPDTVSISLKRHQELLEKERASDAALYAFRHIQTMHDLHRHPAISHEHIRGYVDAIKGYSEAVSRFAAANPPVVAGPATMDDLPF